MIVKVKCMECNGKGITKKICKTCEGVGCSTCNEYGFLTTPCSFCSGTGSKQVEVPDWFEKVLRIYSDKPLYKVFE